MCLVPRSISGHIATGCGDDILRIFAQVCIWYFLQCTSDWGAGGGGGGAEGTKLHGNTVQLNQSIVSGSAC